MSETLFDSVTQLYYGTLRLQSNLKYKSQHVYITHEMKAERVAELAKEVEHFSRLGASRLQHGQAQKALEAYRQAYMRSQLLGHNGYMQRACAFNLGSMLISTGNFTDGLNYLKQAEPPEGQHDGKSNGDLYFNSGLAYEGLQNVEEMKHWYSKALAEFRSEHNVNMEADVLARLGKVYLMSSQFNEAASCLKQLMHVHQKLGDYTKHLQSQAEQASLLLQMDQVAEAENIADDCFMKCQGEELSNSIANVLIELSLTYTQMRSYDKALQCCQSALPVASAKDADMKQIAVLYQNLGVIHSYLGRYQNAIEYHQRAANKYAELNNRKSQGHCFINLGYAYSQLGDIDRAGEYFNHSLQAAKDCGDRKSEWQSLEALGSVAYHHGNIKHSQQHYRAALTVLANSPDAEDTTVQERILHKLTNVAQMQGHKPYEELASLKQQDNIQSRTPVEADSSALIKARSKDGGVIVLKKGAKIKYLRVRRSGTLLKFNKVAEGLDSNMSPVPTGRQVSLGGDEDVFSASTIGISDIDENEEPEPDKRGNRTKKTKQPQRVTTYLEKDEEESEETESEEGETRKQVLDAMRDVVSYGDEKEMSLQTGLESGKPNFRQALMNRSETVSEGESQSEDETQSKEETHSENETSDDDEQTDVTDSIENTDDEEEEEDGSTRDCVPPKIPSMLPETARTQPLRTYEMPVNAAEHKPMAGNSQHMTKTSTNKGQGIFSSTKVSRGDSGINFFHSEEYEDEDKVYESIRLPTVQEHNVNDDDGSSESDDETESELTERESLPKGKRGKVEFKAFHADLKARRAAEAKADDPVAPKKTSRVCIMM